jgi:hypothetical protein
MHSCIVIFKLLVNNFYVLCSALHCLYIYIYIYILFNKFYVCVGFYYKFYVFLYYIFILIEEFMKHDY